MFRPQMVNFLANVQKMKKKYITTSSTSSMAISGLLAFSGEKKKINGFIKI